MEKLYSDTDDHIEEVHIRMLSEAPPWKKIKMLSGLIKTSRNLARAGLRQRFPDDDEEQLRKRLAVLIYGKELTSKLMEITLDD